MKKYWALVPVILGILVAGFFVLRPKPSAPVRIFGQISSPTPGSSVVIGNYAVDWFAVEDMGHLELIANFSEKLPASRVKEKYNCRALVSGGFYLENGTPAGLFLTQGETLRGWVNNRLFDGVLSVNSFLTPRITREIPRDDLLLGLQTGPILIENDQVLKLSLGSDKPARRIVALITGENKLYFIAVYDPEQKFNGPNLIDLPDIVSKFGLQTGVAAADAINLDGGTASVFMTGSISLSEAQPVGSFFCIKRD